MLTIAVAKHLNRAGLVVYGQSGADAFLEGFRPAPAAQVALFAREGRAGVPEGYGSEWPGVQALVRAGAPGVAQESYDKAMGLRAALHGLRQTRLDAGGPDEVWVVQCTATTAQPVSLGPDPEGRLRWSVTWDFQTHHRP